MFNLEWISKFHLGKITKYSLRYYTYCDFIHFCQKKSTFTKHSSVEFFFSLLTTKDAYFLNFSGNLCTTLDLDNRSHSQKMLEYLPLERKVSTLRKPQTLFKNYA